MFLLLFGSKLSGINDKTRRSKIIYSQIDFKPIQI
jgi:hypothetical protein